jgi:hypothetical protein
VSALGDEEGSEEEEKVIPASIRWGQGHLPPAVYSQSSQSCFNHVKNLTGKDQACKDLQTEWAGASKKERGLSAWTMIHLSGCSRMRSISLAWRA